MKRKSSKVFLLALSLCIACQSGSAFGFNWKMGDKSKQETPQTEVNKPKKVSEKQPEEENPVELYNHGVELFQMSQSQAERGDDAGQKSLLKQSIKTFEQVLKLDPKGVDAQSNIGFAYLTLKDYKNAIKAFEKALEMNPRHLNTLNGLSTAYAFNGQIDEAVKTFDQLTILDPTNPQFFFNKGSVLQKAGRIDESMKAYQEAIRLSPNDQRSLFNLATLYENQGNIEEAKPLYVKAKSVDISNPIGLEAVRRIEQIEAFLKQSASDEQNKNKE